MRLYFHYVLKHHIGQMAKLHWLSTVQWKDGCEWRTTVYKRRVWPMRYEGLKTEYQPTNQPKNNHRLRISSSASQHPLVHLVTPACETHRCSKTRIFDNCTWDCAWPNVFPDKAAGLVVLLRTSTTNGSMPLWRGRGEGVDCLVFEPTVARWRRLMASVIGRNSGGRAPSF